MKNVPGRKTDLLDCQWLQQLHSFGLLRGSFRPKAESAALRSYLRHRDTLVAGAAAFIQRMQKALVLMNVQLHNVISDLTGLTGMRILRDIVAGETHPERLAEHRHARIRASQQEIADSLRGHEAPRPDLAQARGGDAPARRSRRRLHLVRKRGQLLAHIQNLNHCPQPAGLREATRVREQPPGRGHPLRGRSEGAEEHRARSGAARMLRRAAHGARARPGPAREAPSGFYLLRSIPGFGKVLALTILCELHDVTRFARVQQFASYARLVKCAKESAGKKYGTSGAKMATST